MTPAERAARGAQTGRPLLDDDVRLAHIYAVRLTTAERDKLQALGGGRAIRSWLAGQKPPRRKQ